MQQNHLKLLPFTFVEHFKFKRRKKDSLVCYFFIIYFWFYDKMPFMAWMGNCFKHLHTYLLCDCRRRIHEMSLLLLDYTQLAINAKFFIFFFFNFLASSHMLSSFLFKIVKAKFKPRKVRNIFLKRRKMNEKRYANQIVNHWR